ncbi:MAG: hypothetical protein J6M17_00695 [Ruminococcus sp.]|nr:hypothetical protein [Ruminococcus sp.]
MPYLNPTPIDDLAAEYEKYGYSLTINSNDHPNNSISNSHFININDADNRSKGCKIFYGKDRFLLIKHNFEKLDENTGFYGFDYYIYNYGDKEPKQFVFENGEINFFDGTYAYAYDYKSGYFYRLNKNLEVDAKFKKYLTTVQTGTITHDLYYGDSSSVYGIDSSGGVLFHGVESQGENDVEHLYYLESDFKTLTELPLPEKGQISTPDHLAMYNKKVYDTNLGMYLDMEKKEWYPFDNSVKEGLGVLNVIGKYLITAVYVYDMEKDEYVTKNFSLQTGQYYGGDSSILGYGTDRIIKTYIPVEPIEGEGKPDEVLWESSDVTMCYVIDNKYYISENINKGVCFGEFGKGADGEVTLVSY